MTLCKPKNRIDLELAIRKLMIEVEDGRTHG
jgi:hypothetical protein